MSADAINLHPSAPEQSGFMDTTVEIRAISRYETSADGNFVKLIASAADAGIVHLNFVTDCLSGLLVTLPALLASAERCRRNDPTVRLVFGLSRFQVELGSDRKTRILTLATNDEFSVSFGLTEAQSGEIAEASENLRATRSN
ncbi:MAG TPA: hypothetical protein VGF97_09075 [Rhizomicrobium sp.]